MKRLILLGTFVFSMVIFFSGCEKNSDTARLRLTKIADNQAMENPFLTLEYNSKGLLSKVIEMEEEKLLLIMTMTCPLV